MSIDSLTNKYYILKKGNNCFCSKCGKKILNDTYQFSKHQEECKIKFVDKFNAYNENDVYGYAFRIQNGKLLFLVYQPQLELVPGFNDKYNGAKWKVKFKATFSLDTKEIIEEGLYNVDVWFKMLLEKANSICLNTNNPELIIKKCFKSIPYLYSYGNFLDIYRQRGYHYNNIDINKLKLINNDKKLKCKSFSDLENIIDVYEWDIDNDVVLEMNIYDHKKNKIGHVFISKDFYYSDDDIIYEEMFGLKGHIEKKGWQENTVKHRPHYIINSIEKFNKKYPELMIQNYLDGGGTNLFQAVLSSNYNKVIENLCKSGLGVIADNIEFLSNINIYGNNVKEIFGVNINIMKQFNNKDNVILLKEDGIYKAIENVLSIQPAIFNLKLSKQALHIIYSNFVPPKTKTHSNTFKIKGIKDLNKNELLKLIKLFCDNHMDIYYYRDYMEICHELGAYPYGKVPKDIILAHEYVVEIYECHKNKLLFDKFKNAVTKKEYLLLDSLAEIDKDGNIHYKHDEEQFRIIVPKTQFDLTKESECLNHCVRTYIKKVADGQTFILFLRKKEDIKKPFATIEVTPDKILVQLKAVNNTHASKEAQSFVKKWAEDKKIKIKSFDITD